MKQKSEELNIVDILKKIAKTNSELLSHCMVSQNEITEYFTYESLDKKAKSIAAYLQSKNLKKERVIIALPQSLDFIAAFFGCLYAGVVAVPSYPPFNQKQTSRIKAVAKDSDSKYIIANTKVINLFKTKDESLDIDNFELINIEDIKDNFTDAYSEVEIQSDDLAFLQYTSGSTGLPKGVMINHHNILVNIAMIGEVFKDSSKDIFGGWLPFFHDMGLISMVIRPVYYGTTSYLMNPVEFIKNPLSWLEVISKYKVTDCGGPNFGYDSCTKEIPDEKISSLDLSHWRVAYNGAEPIRSNTLRDFYQKFKACGFKEEAFLPCYGMAEVTLFVTGSRGGELPVVTSISNEEFEKGNFIEDAGSNSKEMVSSGVKPSGEMIKIVNPDDLKWCNQTQIGEIWVSGEHVSKGYWNKEELNKQTFNAYTSDTNEGPFLRTGDMGFMNKDGELFITGRMKDLIIIRGKNFVPQDIEFLVESSDESIKKNCTSAFSIDKDNEELLVVIAEIDKKNAETIEPDKLKKLISRKISSEFGLVLHDILFINSNSIPRTTSGKIQRRACKKLYLENAFAELDFNLTHSK